MAKDTNIVRPTQVLRQNWLYSTANDFPVAPNNRLVLPVTYPELTGQTMVGWWTTELILHLAGSFMAPGTWKLVMDFISGLEVNYLINGNKMPYVSKPVLPTPPPDYLRSNFNVIIYDNYTTLASNTTARLAYKLQEGTIKIKIKEIHTSLQQYTVEVINPNPALWPTGTTLPDQADRCMIHSWIDLREESQYIPDCKKEEEESSC
ncbi:MAG: hypothetical protein PHX21_12810 [bacterium]|nr:hypothetical protein [bacterium]